MDTTYIAYYRVSTDKQGEFGLGMDAQKQAVQRFGKTAIIAEFVEVESGKRSDRPKLLAALAMAKATGATLLIAKLDRLARNVAFISGLMESGVEFVAADMPTASRLTVHILAAVAEHEAKMISERTKAALAQAKLRGIKLGGWRGGLTNVDAGRQRSAEVRVMRSSERSDNLMPMISLIKDSGVTSLRGIAAKLNEKGVKAPRGGQWNAEQIRRIAA
jgi:DNA invertase Pin-like site-specific DNA recombinase